MNQVYAIFGRKKHLILPSRMNGVLLKFAGRKYFAAQILSFLRLDPLSSEIGGKHCQRHNEPEG